MGINDDPNLVFDLRDVPLFLVKDFIVTFNPNGQKCNASKKVPNENLLAILFGEFFPEQSLFSIETIIIANSNPVKLVHIESSPSPCSRHLDMIPKFMFDRFACVGHAKGTLLGNRGQGNYSPSLTDHNRFVPN